MQTYLDNGATTFVSDKSLNKIVEVLTKVGANPSALYSLGVKAEQEIKLAKTNVANAIGCLPEEIVFTSGGTEASNLAIFGATEPRQRQGKKIITTTFEHASILKPFEVLKEKKGYETVFISPNELGLIDPKEVAAAVDDQTVLVSCMLVNNETGAMADIGAISKLCKRKNPNVLIHCDAVQAFGKLPINVKKMGVDMMSISAHKIHAPKGIGALYCKKGIRLTPLIYGGEQEKGLRPGTENVAYAAAFGVAAEEIEKVREENFQHVTKLNRYLRENLGQIEGGHINSPGAEQSSPYILNFSVSNIRSEIMLHFLEQEEIYVASGSACAKGAASHVIRSLGYSNDRADSAIRISFSEQNTFEDIDRLINRVTLGMKTLARSK